MLFLNKDSNKTIDYKKEYFIKKNAITPIRQQIYIMLIKVALKFNFTFASSIRNDSCHLKK
jgi:hypothetical protein